MIETQETKEIDEMTTTASFVLTIGDVRWLSKEVARIKALPNAPKNFNKSMLLRGILESKRAEADEPLESRAA